MSLEVLDFGGGQLEILEQDTCYVVCNDVGIQGAPGESGYISSLLGLYKIQTTVGGEPSSGHIRYNNATQTSATILTVSNLTQDDIDIEIFLSLLRIGIPLVIQDKDDYTNYQIWEISGAPTQNPTYISIPVTLSSSGGSGTTGFANNHQVFLAAYESVGLAVLKSDYSSAYSLLAQQAGTGAPSVLTVANNTLIGRLSGGTAEINDLSVTDVRSLLNINNVNNTSDLDKPISTATQSALDTLTNEVNDLQTDFANLETLVSTLDSDVTTLTNEVENKWDLSGNAGIGAGPHTIGNTTADGATINFRINNVIWASVGATTRELRHSSGGVRFDFESGYLQTAAGATVVDIENTVLKTRSYGNIVSVDWEHFLLKDENSAESWNWSLRIGYDGAGFQFIDGLNRTLHNSGGDPTVDFQSGILYAGVNSSVEWNNYKLMYAGNSVCDWNIGYLYDNLAVASIDWFGRSLIDSSGSASFSWGSRILNDSSSVPSIDWDAHYLYYPSGVVSADYGSGQTADTSAVVSIQWSSRELRNSFGTSTVFWSGTYPRILNRLSISSTGALVPVSVLHLDAGNATACELRFTAGTTTGQTNTDGFQVGIASNGTAELRQRENLAVEIYSNNTLRAQWTGAGNMILDGSIQARGGSGTAGVPFWGFNSNTDCGMYKLTGSSIGFSTTGAARLTIESGGKINMLQGGTVLRGAMTTVYSQINSVGNVGTGEDNLHSFSVASSGFNQNGDSMEVMGSGTFAANANNKRVRLKFGAITLFDTTALAFNGGDWSIKARIFRTSTTTGRSIVEWTSNNVTLTTTCDYQAWAFNFLTSNTLVFTGEATADNDIVQELMQVFWIPVS